MILAVLGERQIAVPRMAVIRRAVLESAAQLRRNERGPVAVETVAHSGARIGCCRAVDVAAEEVRLAAPVERAQAKRLRGRNVFVTVHPPSYAAIVLKEVIYGVQRPACAAANKHDIAPKRLDAPFFVLVTGGWQMRPCKLGIADVEHNAAPPFHSQAVFAET